MQTHLNTLVILQLLPQLQVELWATKEAIDEKYGPSFLMTKAVLTGIGVPFPQNLDGLQICSTLPSPVPSVASLQVSRTESHLTLLSCVCCCQLLSLQADFLAWKCQWLERYDPLRQCSLPCFTLVLRLSIQNNQFNCSRGLDH